jgi:uncharacterized membrane protein
VNRWIIVSILLTLLALGGPLYLYFARPDLLKDPIPTHTNASGEVDGWTPRENILPQWLIMPGFVAGLTGLFLLLPWMSPKGFEIDRFRETFFFLLAVVTLLLGFIQLVFVLGGIEGLQLDTSRLLLGGLSLFFATLGNRLGKVQRNFWMGIRTPWTLASEAVWIQTHRLAAWLWTACGVVLAVVAFAGLPVWLWIAGMIIMALTPVVYSLWLYKRLEKQGKFTPPSSVTEEIP